MTRVYVVTGILTGGNTVQLDETLPTTDGRVRVTVEVIGSAPPKQSLQEYLADLRKRQAARGHVPMTVEQVEDYMKAERESWGD